MRPLLDRFILGVPVLFLKQYPFAWIAFVAFWPSSRLLAGFFLLIMVVGFLALRWQSQAWISYIRREYAGRNGKFYVDQPPISWQGTARSIAILVAWSVLGAFVLRGQFGLSFWQIFIMLVGFTLFYQDTRFFGAAVTYIITATGIAIRFVPGHIEYQLFLLFKEINRIEKCEYQKGKNWDLFTREKDATKGLLMTPKNPNGFTRRVENVFIAPNDRDQFLAQLPHGFA